MRTVGKSLVESANLNMCAAISPRTVPSSGCPKVLSGGLAQALACCNCLSC
jgi:hypothetical protein